jgi:thiol:disulfide interchange protein
MKQYLIFLSLIIISLTASLAFKNDKHTIINTTAIQFIEQDWNKALAEAKSTNKLVFIDVYATWCGPCKQLKQKTFTDKKVAEFFNQNFINVSIDAEKGVGVELSNKYAVSAYPTLIFTNAEGAPVLYTVGYMSASELISFAKAALKKANKK